MTTIPPVVRTVTVPWAREAAFRRFTEEISSWWPRSTHSIGQERSERVTLEGRVGGRIFETIQGGDECVWGTVQVWDPPHRVAFTWHPGQKAETAQTVEVRFSGSGEGTLVELTHRGWELLGKQAPRMRRAYGLGWIGVLRIYAGRGWGPFWPLIGLQTLVAGVKRRFRSPHPLPHQVYREPE
jgi:uncharacterized protein YndB with AHSA1/START domain